LAGRLSIRLGASAWPSRFLQVKGAMAMLTAFVLMVGLRRRRHGAHILGTPGQPAANASHAVSTARQGTPGLPLRLTNRQARVDAQNGTDVIPHCRPHSIERSCCGQSRACACRRSRRHQLQVERQGRQRPLHGLSPPPGCKAETVAAEPVPSEQQIGRPRAS